MLSFATLIVDVSYGYANLMIRQKDTALKVCFEFKLVHAFHIGIGSHSLKADTRKFLGIYIITVNNNPE